MATALHNLSDYDPTQVPSGAGLRVGIVVSEWNPKVTHALLSGALATLTRGGVSEKDITVAHVPGSFELVYGSARMVRSQRFDAVIALGCVIKGDTPHFDYICEGTTAGLARLNAEAQVPVIYGLLTCNDMDQAEARSGGMLGNKGDECAVTALKMAAYAKEI